MPRPGIAVLGGGIAGLIAARVLRRHRMACSLIEPRTDLVTGGAGLMLWPAALRALVELGFGEVRGLGVPIRESILRDTRGRTLLRIPLGTKLASLPRAMPRSLLVQQLARDLPCEWSVRAGVAIHRQRGKQYIVLDDRTTLAVDGAIVATGMRGDLRQSIAPGAEARYCGRNSWRGLCAWDDARLASGVAVETLGRGCRVGLFPVAPGLVYWFVQCNQPERAQPLQNPSTALAARLADWPDPIPSVVAGTPDGAIVETPILEMLPAPRWHSDEVLLIGDAAHGMAPDLGRGACTAIVNLLDLDRQLARHGTFRVAAAAFARRRRWRTRLVQHASRIAGEVRQLENPWLRHLRNTVWRYAPPLWLLRSVVAPLMARRTLA
jgi:2-polyprenyl-6-methoxyphenol hydroxylase-like FAD-dependent oxidoreductase